MSDAETLMWTVDEDPVLRSAFLQLSFLDCAPDITRFRRRMARAVRVLPRLGQRVVPPPVGRLAPTWEVDPTFDLGYHVRHLALPPGSTDRDLLDLAARLFEDPFDRSRPLWQLTVLEGLPDGRAALLAKLHHTITDGVGGVRLSMQFLDIERDAPDPPEPDGDEEDDAATRGAGNPFTAAVRLAGGAVDLVTHPDAAVETVRSLVRQGVVADPARSPLWTDRSVRRGFEVLSVPLDDLKRAAKALGGTVNDAYVTAVAGGAGRYHRALGVDVDELRMAMPVNRREDGSAGGNAFSPTRVLVPVGGDVTSRFAAVHERLTVTKGEKALALVEGLAGMMNALPAPVLVRLARQQVSTVDFTTSNLRAAPFDLYVAGARIESNHPMGPTAGTAFNATAMSYRGAFDVGLNADLAAIDDPELLRACVLEGFEEVLGASPAG